MLGRLLTDAQLKPHLLTWNGAINAPQQDDWGRENDSSLPPDLRVLWSATGGGDIFESETLLGPFVDPRTQNAARMSETDVAGRSGTTKQACQTVVGQCFTKVLAHRISISATVATPWLSRSHRSRRSRRWRQLSSSDQGWIRSEERGALRLAVVTRPLGHSADTMFRQNPPRQLTIAAPTLATHERADWRRQLSGLAGDE